MYPINSIPQITFTSIPTICMAAEKVTPYEPEVQYTKPISKQTQQPELKRGQPYFLEANN